MTETKSLTWDDVRRFADEIKLQLHLAGMDARTRWNELQPRLAELEAAAAREGDRMSKAVEATLVSIGTSLHELRDEIVQKAKTK